MKNKILPVLFMMFVFINQSKAQQPEKVMDLKKAIQYALQENTDVKQQNLAIIRSKYQTQETKSMAMPQINASGQFTDNLKLPEQLLPGEIFGQPGTFIPVKFGVQYTIPLSARWDQLIFDKAYFIAVQQSKTAESMTKLQKDQVEQEVIYNVATSYYQTIILREQRQIIEANLSTINQSLHVAEVQYENQMVRKIDRDQLMVNQSNTQADLDNSVVAYAQSLDMLKVIMGYPLNDTLILNDTIEDEIFVAPENSVFDNPQLLITDKQLEMKELEIKGINSRYYPSLMGFAQYGYQTQFNEFTSKQMQWTSNAAIGASLSIPIFDGLQKKHQVQQRNIEFESIKMDKQLTENTLNASYQNALKKYLQSEKTVTNQKANFQLAESVVDAVLTNYTNGLSSLSDLTNAGTALKGAQTQYLTALLQKKIAALDILRANGNINDLLNN